MVPSRELTYPTLGSLENHRFKSDGWEWDMLVSRRVSLLLRKPQLQQRGGTSREDSEAQSEARKTTNAKLKPLLVSCHARSCCG